MDDMTNPPTTLERAFALARSGEHSSVNEIRQRLKAERYDQVEGHLAGHSIGRQLRQLCDTARRDRAD
jgi:hypothetical protein